MRILLLGGTGSIGPHYVQAAVERGHAVTIFNRGQRAASLPAGVEHLRGDRNGDLNAIRSRDWDAVVDLATYQPEWVRSVGQALEGRVGHYTLISSIVVYDLDKGGVLTHEGSPLTEYRGKPEYPALKVLCEQEAQKCFAGCTLILRPGYIVGPGDYYAWLPYWPARIALGGDVMVPNDPKAPFQFIDVRDLASWSLDLMEFQKTGAFNVVGPVRPFSELLETAAHVAGTSPLFQWIPAAWLASQPNPQAWANLLYWTPELWNFASRMHASNDRAIAQGLKVRALRTTIADTLRWYQSLSEAQQVSLLWGSTPGQDGQYWHSWREFLEGERAALAQWRATNGNRAGTA